LEAVNRRTDNTTVKKAKKTNNGLQNSSRMIEQREPY